MYWAHRAAARFPDGRFYADLNGFYPRGRAADPARVLLDELAEAHLLTEPRPGRYTCHDLLRAYAAELSGAADRRTAAHRFRDHLRPAATGYPALGDRRDPDRQPMAGTIAPGYSAGNAGGSG